MTDYIKRENAKRAVWGCSRDTGIDEAPFEYAEGLLEDVPSEDVAPVRHGRWKDEFKEDAEAFVKHRYVCTVCGEWQTYGKTQYCSNCGAKMDGEREDNGRTD